MIYNWSPIHYACHYGSIEMVKLLVEKNVNLEAEDNNKLASNSLCMSLWISRNGQITD